MLCSCVALLLPPSKLDKSANKLNPPQWIFVETVNSLYRTPSPPPKNSSNARCQIKV